LEEINPPTPWLVAPFTVCRNVWRYRFLVWSFMQRDIRVRYRNSILGYVWSLLEPALLSLTYYMLFTVIRPKSEPRYALWVVVGVLVWGYFTKLFNTAVGSLTGNAGLIQLVYFPREIFSVTAAGSELVVMLLSLVLAVPLMIYFQIAPSIYLLMIPAGLLLAGLLGLGVGLAFACLNAVHRDVEHFSRFIIRAGFFLSPIMWTLEMVAKGKHQAQHIAKLMWNPMVLPITMVRNGIEGKPIPNAVSYFQIFYCVAVCVGAFVIGTMFFKRFESEAVKSL